MLIITALFLLITLKKTSQELRKLPYTSYLENKVLMSFLSVLPVVVCAMCRGCPVCPDDHEFMINMSDSLTRGCKSDDVMKKNIFLTIEIFHPCAVRPSESQTQRWEVDSSGGRAADATTTADHYGSHRLSLFFFFNVLPPPCCWLRWPSLLQPLLTSSPSSSTPF